MEALTVTMVTIRSSCLKWYRTCQRTKFYCKKVVKCIKLYRVQNTYCYGSHLKALNETNLIAPISSHPHTSHTLTHPHRAGDRLQSIGSYDLRSVTRKEALEIIRSCDQVSVDVMIKRTATIQKPVPQVCVCVWCVCGVCVCVCGVCVCVCVSEWSVYVWCVGCVAFISQLSFLQRWPLRWFHSLIIYPPRPFPGGSYPG